MGASVIDLTKKAKYRNPKLMALANAAPHCMLCNEVHEGAVVGAHPPEGGDSGMATKAHDLVAFVCSECHDEIDGRAGQFDMETRMHWWLRAFYATMLWIVENGRSTILAVSAEPPKYQRPSKVLPRRPTL